MTSMIFCAHNLNEFEWQGAIDAIENSIGSCVTVLKSEELVGKNIDDIIQTTSNSEKAIAFKVPLSTQEAEEVSVNNDYMYLREQFKEAMSIITEFRLQHESLLTEIEVLKERHTVLYTEYTEVLWKVLPQEVTRFSSIPVMKNDIKETPTVIGKYNLEHLIGSGEFAKVYACTYTSSDDIIDDDDNTLCIKAIEKSQFKNVRQVERIANEIMALQDTSLYHSGILKLVECIHTKTHVYLVTHKGGIDLFDFTESRHGQIGEHMVLYILQQLSLVVNHVHLNGYCHRDVKPENILITAEKKVTLVDFGLCSKVSDTSLCQDFCGSPGFFAPELLSHAAYDGRKADVWSIGCVMLELMIGGELFEAYWMSSYKKEKMHNPKAFEIPLKRSIAQLKLLIEKNTDLHNYSRDFNDLLFHMLCINPAERWSMQQVVDHLEYNTPKHIAHVQSIPRSKSVSLISDVLFKSKLQRGPSLPLLA